MLKLSGPKGRSHFGPGGGPQARNELERNISISIPSFLASVQTLDNRQLQALIFLFPPLQYLASAYLPALPPPKTAEPCVWFIGRLQAI